MSIYTSKTDPERHRIVIFYGESKPKEFQFRGSKAAAKKFHAEKELELGARGRRACRTAPKFSDFCLERYSPHAERHLRASTYANRKYTLATLIGFFGAMRLDEITTTDIERFQTARKAAGGVGHVKINDDVKKLLTVLNYAESIRVPVKIPKFRKLPQVKTEGRVKVWTKDEVQKLYATLQRESPHLLPITVAMINTGIRKGEALALEWSCVDLERDLLLIYPNAEWQPKNGKPREVPIGKAVRPWLSGPHQHPRWVFPTLPTMKFPEGHRYAAWPQNQWDAVRKASGIGGSPHVCRHTFASHFLAACPDLYLLAQILGHSQTRVTALYTHLLADHLASARDVVNIPAPLMLVADHGSPHGSPTVSAGSGGKARRSRQ